MTHRIPAVWVVVAAATVSFFFALGSGHLFDEDEPKNAECGREMFVRGDWLVPTFNYELRTDKPILLYWLMLASYHLFGVSEFAARFFSALLGVSTCVVTYHLGARLFSPRAGLWAGLAMATSLMFTTVARAATPDSTLIFLTTLSLFLFVRSRRWDGQNESQTLPKQSASFLPLYAVMAVAVLAKGPVGVLLPCCVIGLFAYLEALRPTSVGRVTSPIGLGRAGDLSYGSNHASRWQRVKGWFARWFQPRPFFRTILQMRPLLIALCLAVIALPWYVAVGLKTDGAWLRGFLGNHNVGRFLEPMENHRGPVFYYLIAIMMGFFPWSVFLPMSVVNLARRIRSGGPDRQGLVFIACWAGVYVGFFTLARTKLPNYVLPCYPALALMVGYFFEACPWDVRNEYAWVYRWALRSLAAVGVVIAIALPTVAYFLLPGQQWIGVVGAVPIIGAVIAARQFQCGAGTQARRTFGWTAVALVVVLFGVAAPQISSRQDGHFLAASLPDTVASPRIATYQYSPPGLVYYARRKIERCRQPEDIREFLAQDGSFVAMRSDRVESVRPFLPEGVEVLAQRQQFLRRHNIVLLGRRDERQSSLKIAIDPATQRR